MSNTITIDELLDPQAISDKLGITRTHFYKIVSRQPDFPRPCIVLSQKMRRWKATDFNAWIDKQAKQMAR